MDVNVSMNNLKLESLEAIKAGSDDLELTKLVDGIIASKKAQIEAEKRAEQFNDEMTELVAELPNPPQGVYNFFARYMEVEQDADAPAEEVKLADGTTEMRKPKEKVMKWVVITNHACGSRSGASATSNQVDKPKRAITMLKRNGDKLETIGNFRNGAEAATFIGKGEQAKKVGVNAKRDVLEPMGYIIDAYTGADFTVPKA